MSEHGAKKNLQPAITANIVERAPHNVGFLMFGTLDRGSQTRKAVRQHFGCARRAGGEKHPLGFVTVEFHPFRRRNE